MTSHPPSPPPPTSVAPPAAGGAALATGPAPTRGGLADLAIRTLAAAYLGALLVGVIAYHGLWFDVTGGDTPLVVSPQAIIVSKPS